MTLKLDCPKRKIYQLRILYPVKISSKNDKAEYIFSGKEKCKVSHSVSQTICVEGSTFKTSNLLLSGTFVRLVSCVTCYVIQQHPKTLFLNAYSHFLNLSHQRLMNRQSLDLCQFMATIYVGINIFDKIQHLFMLKTLRKPGIRGDFPNLIKGNYETSTADTTL